MRYGFALAVLALVVGFACAGVRAQAPPADEQGFRSLFNGKDLAGWTRMNNGNWVVENGIVKYTGGGNGWLRSNEKFTDFHAIAEWRYPNQGNNDAGFFFRAGEEGNPWPSRGHQLNMGPGQNFASVGGVQGAVARFDLIKPPGGEWNVYELILVGNRGLCLVNGQKAWHATGFRFPEGGYLGWQGEGHVLEIRSLRVRDLSPAKGS